VLALGIVAEPEHPGRRLVLAIALSMAATALGGLLINAVTELTTTSWTVSLVGFTCACSLVALVRREPRPRSPSAASARIPAITSRVRRQAIPCLLALLLLAGAVVLTERNSRSEYDKPVTQLTLSPSPGAGARAVRLTVTNLTGRTERMILTVTDGSRPAVRRLVSLLPAQHWVSQEPVLGTGLRAALTRPGRSSAFSEVTWGELPTSANARRQSAPSTSRRAHPHRRRRLADTRARATAPSLRGRDRCRRAASHGTTGTHRCRS